MVQKMHLANARYFEEGKNSLEQLRSELARIHTACNEYVTGDRVVPFRLVTCKRCIATQQVTVVNPHLYGG